MGEVSYKGHRYPEEIIAHCGWLYHRFPLSFREVEQLTNLTVPSVGMRLYSHATALGKALLSQLEPAEARRRLTSAVLPKFTERTVNDPQVILKELALVRENGYATDEGEYLSGTRCVAVPLVDDGADLITAISVTAPATRTSTNWPAPVLSQLQDTAGRIRTQLGYARFRPAL